MKKAALAWAAAGWRVFPLRPNDKKPLPGSHGFHDASSDSDAVAAMPWELDGVSCNLGVATGNGLVVLDVDCKNGKDGFGSLAKVGLTKARLAQFGTFTVRTPGGGIHYYFKTETDVRSGADVLGKGSGVDLRGAGGYIVSPPSEVNGIRYEVVAPSSDGDGLVANLAQLAEWDLVAKHLPAAPEPSWQQQAPSSWEELRFGQAATPDVIERARSYLRKCPPAVAGQGGHNATFKVASTLANGFCLDKETAYILLQEWNQRCLPPWSQAELRHKLLDAALCGPPPGKPLGWLRYSVPPEQTALVPSMSAEDSDEDGDEAEACAGTWIEEDEDEAKMIPYPPHYIGATAAWIEKRSEKPYRPFAVLSALSIWATLVGRKVRFENQAGILYCGMVTACSNGKDAPLDLPEKVLHEVGVSRFHITGRLSSWNAGMEALQAVWYNPVVLSIVDEAAGYFRGIAMKGDYGLGDFMKAAWSRGLGVLNPQARTRKSGSTHLRPIFHPFFPMLLSTQPSALGDAIKSEQLEDGLLPRTLWVVRRKFDTVIREENLRLSRKLEDSIGGLMILERAKEVWKWVEGEDKCFQDIADLELEEPADNSTPQREIWKSPIEFTATSEAAALFSDFVATTQSRIRPAAEGWEPPYGLLWAKAAENSKRIALISAAARCAATSGPFTITAEEAQWAVNFIGQTVKGAIEWAKQNLADTPFQRMTNRICGIIRAAGPNGVSRRNLNRKLRHSYQPSKVEEGLQSLRDSGTISVETVQTRGAPKIVYRLANRQRGKAR